VLIRFCDAEFKVVEFVLWVLQGFDMQYDHLLEILHAWDLKAANIDSIVLMACKNMLISAPASTLPSDLASVIRICILEQLNDCVLPVIMKNCGETFHSELKAFPRDIPEACVMIHSRCARPCPLTIIEFFKQLQKHVFDPFGMGFKFLKTHNRTFGASIETVRMLHKQLQGINDPSINQSVKDIASAISNNLKD
jgi:hypothetical protein